MTANTQLSASLQHTGPKAAQRFDPPRPSGCQDDWLHTCKLFSRSNRGTNCWSQLFLRWEPPSLRDAPCGIRVQTSIPAQVRLGRVQPKDPRVLRLALCTIRRSHQAKVKLLERACKKGQRRVNNIRNVFSVGLLAAQCLHLSSCSCRSSGSRRRDPFSCKLGKFAKQPGKG